jgi:hypothetical protein
MTHAVAGPFGAENRCRECVLRDLSAQQQYRIQGGIEIEAGLAAGYRLQRVGERPVASGHLQPSANGRPT